MPTESFPNRSPVPTPGIEIEAQDYVLDVLKGYGLESIADEPMRNHKTGELVHADVALAACEPALAALEEAIKKGDKYGESPKVAATDFIRAHQERFNIGEEDKVAFLKSAPSRS